MKKRGLVVVEPSAETLAAWRTFMEQVHPKLRGSLVPADLYDRVQQSLAAFRAAQAAPKK